MIENIKSVLIGLTKEFGPDETSSALGYGLSLAQQAIAHATWMGQQRHRVRTSSRRDRDS